MNQEEWLKAHWFAIERGWVGNSEAMEQVVEDGEIRAKTNGKN